MRLLVKAAIVAGVAVSAAQAPAAAAPNPVNTVRVPCSVSALHNAVVAANTNAAVLRLAPSCSYNLTTPLPVITGRITLKGANTSIKRALSAVPFRILDVGLTGDLTVEDVFVMNGLAGTGDGAGIRNAGRLTLRRVTVVGNVAQTGNGAGLANTGRAAIRNSVFTTNLALAGNGAGIHNNGELHLTDSTVAGNALNARGAGVYTAAGRVTRIVRSAVNSNLSASQTGGGIASAGTTTLDNTWVRLNKSVGAGGGILVLPGGAVTLHRTGVRDNVPDNCAPANTVRGCVN
ncbi:hypothetical protein GT755_25025 [Herbidospora sp. NEAU-GS84]|uniref:Right-handed parallel beta-helix repeat-containing protein n=1 Tax=Herbidospora solisilvae TaxID=2696284 RepID=A0A7C9NQV1_9ACTN|nr:hypothetical protein [Herbidospora solisilvae]NAS24936.1 hypothetical protein [Herbidospora solisilvae]